MRRSNTNGTGRRRLDYKKTNLFEDLNKIKNPITKDWWPNFLFVVEKFLTHKYYK